MNSYRLAYLHMTAQAVGTLIHVTVLSIAVDLMPEDPVLAIGVSTSISSFFKLALVVGLGLLNSEIRASNFISFQNYWRSRQDQVEKANFWRIQVPSMIMFCAEGWAF